MKNSQCTSHPEFISGSFKEMLKQVQHDKKRKGFTLVELSIVLVIIGLLIGGILVAQSLIESAKINKGIQQLQQFDIAVNSFKSRYRSLPGDSDKLEFGGNNNGFIEGGFANNPNITSTREYKNENRNFWPSLQIAGLKIDGISEQLPLIANNVNGITIKASGDEQNVPQFALGENTGVFAFMKKVDTAAESRFINNSPNMSEIIPAGNFYYLADFSTMTSHGVIPNSGFFLEPSISVDEAFAFDAKTDDGIAVSGDVIFAGSAFSSEAKTKCVAAFHSDEYNIDSDEAKCILAVRMTE